MKFIRVFLLLSLVIAISSACDVQNTNSDEKAKSYIINNDSLKTGRYYLNGDTSEDYVEVYDDKTLRWHGVDTEGLDKLEAEWLSSLHSYTIVDFTNIDTTMIAWDWIEESDTARGFVYIDENTFKFNDNEIFIYTE